VALLQGLIIGKHIAEIAQTEHCSGQNQCCGLLF
jgi:hypothetical protein